MANELVLATPTLRGKSDVITNYDVNEPAVEPGYTASVDANGKVVKYDGTAALAGVAAYKEKGGRQSVIKSGLGVVVRVVAEETPAVGQPANVVKATGLFTTAEANGSTIIATKAVFMSQKQIALHAFDRTPVENCAIIDFEGGLR